MYCKVAVFSVAVIITMAAISLLYLNNVSKGLESEFTELVTDNVQRNVSMVEAVRVDDLTLELSEELQQVVEPVDESNSYTKANVTDVAETSESDEYCCEEELEIQEDDGNLTWKERRTKGLIEKHGDIPEVQTFVELFWKMKQREVFTPQEYLELLRVTEIVQPYPGNAGAYERFKKFIEENGEENMSMMYREHWQERPRGREELVYDE